MSHYEILLSVWRRERTDKMLPSLEEDFFEKTRAYLNHLETQSQNEPDPILAELFLKRWQRVSYVLNDIIALRTDKHIRDSRDGIKSPSLVPIEEKRFREKIDVNIIEYRDRVLGIETAEISDNEVDDDFAYRLVLFTKKDHNPSIGSDLKTYGPFNSGDIAFLPNANMKNYLKRSMIELIEL